MIKFEQVNKTGQTKRSAFETLAVGMKPSGGENKTVLQT